MPGTIAGELTAWQVELNIGRVGAHPDQVCLELSDHGQDVEEQPTDWVCRIVARRVGLLGRS
jgi:hypothetical protein